MRETGVPVSVGEPQKLNQFKVGQRGEILAVDGEQHFRRRLLELGLVPGADVAVTRVAPLGDPIEIEVRDTRLSLRKSDAGRITVALHAPAPAEQARAKQVRVAATTRRRFRVAIAGNPNTGKTTLFNALTRATAQVGNYPGITVERVIGNMKLVNGVTTEVVDVPGCYSLTARSREEQVAIEEILGWTGDREPDLVVVVLNASAYVRSHYLLLQIQEFGIPIVAAVNMMDEARQQGITIDTQGIAAHLGIPVVGVVARTGEGLDSLKLEIERMLLSPRPHQTQAWHWQPSQDLSGHIDDIAATIDGLAGDDATDQRRRAIALWCLLSLSENDDLAHIPDHVRSKTIAVRQDMYDHGHDLDLEVVGSRYEHIDTDLPAFIIRSPYTGALSVTERIDRVLTHPVSGALVFFAVMALIFTALFDWSTPLAEGIEGAVSVSRDWLHGVMPASVVTSLLLDGVLAGVGAVLVFLPQILLLFFFITVLEGSGYLSRAAFMFDRVMKRLGLHGRAFVPMLSGFACCVPAVLATRTIESRRDRLLTIMILPLISCSARLPVYVLVIAVLFPASVKLVGPISVGTALMLGIYLASTALAILAGVVLSRTVLKGRPQPLIMELPPYRLPSMRTVAVVLRQKAWVFLKTAGTVIVIASVLLWGLLNFPRAEQPAAAASSLAEMNAQRAIQIEQSYAGHLGHLIEPAIAPLGFDWKIGIGLIGAFAAREVFVATMGLVYGVGEVNEESIGLRQAMQAQRRPDGSPLYSPLTVFSLLIFFMIALQCISTIATVRQETGSWRWTLFQLAYISTLAYLASLGTYQIGLLLGFS